MDDPAVDAGTSTSTASRDDVGLLNRIGLGDEDAMAAFYREHGRVVLGARCGKPASACWRRRSCRTRCWPSGAGRVRFGASRRAVVGDRHRPAAQLAPHSAGYSTPRATTDERHPLHPSGRGGPDRRGHRPGDRCPGPGTPRRGCEHCRAEANRWDLVARGVRGLTAATPEPVAPEPVAEGLRRRRHSVSSLPVLPAGRAARPRIQAGPRRRATLVAGAAAALVLIGAAGVGLGHVGLAGA